MTDREQGVKNADAQKPNEARDLEIKRRKDAGEPASPETLENLPGTPNRKPFFGKDVEVDEVDEVPEKPVK